MKVCAVIMTAYKSKSFICESINSLKNQKLPLDWKIDLYIGVDGCSETAEYLKKMNIPFYFSHTNVGTYVMSNSLLKKAINSDIFLRFDSDDIASENFLSNGIHHTQHYSIIRNYFKKYYSDGVFKEKRLLKKAYGSIFFTKKILEELGGYHSYRVSCDKFFYLRANKLGYTEEPKDNLPLYWYRIHENSLAQSEKTGLKSDYRKEIEDRLATELKNNIIKITPSYTDLQYYE